MNSRNFSLSNDRAPRVSAVAAEYENEWYVWR